MAAPLQLRDDFDALALRGLAKASRDAGQLRRLLSLAEIHDGGSRGDAAKVGGVGLQTVRDWVLRFNARGPEGLIDAKAPGQVPKLNDAQRRALVQVVSVGTIESSDFRRACRRKSGIWVRVPMNPAQSQQPRADHGRGDADRGRQPPPGFPLSLRFLKGPRLGSSDCWIQADFGDFS